MLKLVRNAFISARWMLMGMMTCVALLQVTCHAHAQTTRTNDSQRATQPSEPDQQRAARSLFDAGTIAFRQLRYEDALESFLQAHKLTNDPILLFSIGMSYDRLYRLPEAIQAFEAYLKAIPDAPNRPAAEERMRVIREHIEAQTPREPEAEPAHAEPAPEPAPTSVERSDTHHGKRVLPQWAFWTGVGATAALAGAMVWSGLDAKQTNEDYKDLPMPTHQSKLYQDGIDAQRRTNALIGATAGIAAATAVVGIFLTDFAGKRSTHAHRQGAPRWSAWLDSASRGVTYTQPF